MSDTFILWGSIAGAAIAIVTLVAKAVKAGKQAVTYFTSLKSSVDTLVENDKHQYMAILRLTVMAENLPLSERIKAGEEYVAKSGNGDVKAYYETHLKPYDHIPKGA